eukprot:Trichotokara_eunicae@DN7109_c0_g1_i1.p1
MDEDGDTASASLKRCDDVENNDLGILPSVGFADGSCDVALGNKNDAVQWRGKLVVANAHQDERQRCQWPWAKPKEEENSSEVLQHIAPSDTLLLSGKKWGKKKKKKKKKVLCVD